MPTVQDVLDALESIAPARFAFFFDHIGLQVGGPSAAVEKVVFSLDPSLAAVRFVRDHGAQMLVSHHPVIWDPLKDIRFDGYKGRVVREMIEGGVAFAAAHTNWDAAPGGINDVLAERIGLREVRPVGSASDTQGTKIVVTAPRGVEGRLIDAMSSAGAGVIGLYERCAFSTTGTGTFRGTEGANPTVGQAGKTETVEESRIEMLCPVDKVAQVVHALVGAHPYEEPAYDVYPLQPSSGQPMARVGALERAMSPKEFRDWLDERLAARTLLCSPEDKTIQTVVVCGGAAADEWQTARHEGTDAFVTGEVPHHLMVEGSESGVAMAACGHFATENPGALRLADAVAGHIAAIECLKFEPQSGEAGRPC